jgi:hypothetical protein
MRRKIAARAVAALAGWLLWVAAAFASSIQSLPVVRLAMGVGYYEDLAFAIAYTPPAGSSASISGISFTATVYGMSWSMPGAPIATIVGTLSGNTVTFLLPASQKASWAPGVYWISAIATDGAYAREVISLPSSIEVGTAQPAFLTSNLGIVGGFTAALTAPVIPGPPPAVAACGFNMTVLVACTPFGGLM